MKISWSHGAHVACFDKIFNDGWGAIIWMKWQKKPWIWKGKVGSSLGFVIPS